MSLQEKYRPTTLSEMVGNRRNILEVNKIVEDYHKKQKIGEYLYDDIELPKILLSGPPGVGKTTLAHVMAKTYNMKLFESNASDSRKKDDLLEILRRVKMERTFDGRKFLILLDEIDGIKEWDLIAEILKKTANPIILTANSDWVIPRTIKSKLKVIKFFPLYLSEVVKRLKQIERKEKIKFDLSKASTDVRASINAVVGNSEKLEKETDPFDVVTEVFCRQEIKNYQQKEHFTWLMENAKLFYSGTELATTLQILALHDLTKNNNMLTCLPTGTAPPKMMYPNYKRLVTAQYKK